MNQRRREISKAYQEILSSRMNQRRQDILRAYHQMVLAQVPEAHIRLAFEEAAAYFRLMEEEEEEGRRVYEEWLNQFN